MTQQLQGIIVAVLVLGAIAWLIYRAKKLKSNPCGSCSSCAGINLDQALKPGNQPPSASQPTDNKTSDPAPPND